MIIRPLLSIAVVASTFLVMPMTHAQPRNDRQSYDYMDQRGSMSHSERRELERRRAEDRMREARRDERRNMRNTCYRDNRGRTYTMRRDGSRDYARC